MSTVGTLLVSLAAVSALGFAPTTASKQTGGTPEKIIGPTAVSTSSTLHTLSGTRHDQAYTYTVQMSDTSIIDRQVDIYDASGSLVPDATVTIPANSYTGDFTVYAVAPGDDSLTAVNANGSASMDVTVY